ncbi:MAG: sigma 54-interacting transcriptional regulator, partial [Planctomycetaceae bacterium]
FTGASASRVGCFELADKGTIFLDEISEMPPAVQSKLLRVLEDRRVRRVGGTREIAVDVRLLAATNADVRERLTSGRFREVKLWKKPADVILQTIANTATTGVMAVQPGGQLIAAVTANNAIQVWDSNSLAIRQTLTGFTAEVRSLVFSSDGGRLFAAAADQYIRAWDLETGTLSAVIQTPVELNTIALIDMAAPTEEVPHPEQVLVSGGLENVLRTWTVPTTAPARTQWSRPAVQHVASSPDGSTLLQVTTAGEFQVLSLSEQPEGSTEPQHYAAAALWKTANAVVTDVSLLRQPSESPEPVWAVAATAATQVSLHQLADGAILDSWQAGTVPLTSVTA